MPRDRTTLKGSMAKRDLEKEDGPLQPNNIFINHAKDFCLAFLLFAWQVLPLWHKTHPKGLHRAFPAFCFSQQHKPALHKGDFHPKTPHDATNFPVHDHFPAFWDIKR